MTILPNKGKICLLLILLILSAAISLFIGSSGNIATEWRELFSGNDTLSVIYWEIRLPRILGAAAAGMLLAAAGCTVQLLFRNPLASPHVLGSVNASALGAVAVLLLGGKSLWGMMLGSMSGAAAALLGLLWINCCCRRTAALLLTGIALNAFASSAMSGMLFVAGERLEGVIFWLLGGFWKLDWQNSTLLITAAAVILPLLLSIHREMNMLYLGETAARHAGVNTRRVIATAVIAAAAATAAAVGCCGVIGFVGLLVPHIARKILGCSFISWLTGSALIGAMLMILSDLAARTLSSPLEIPVGVLTSLLAAPFFMVLIVNSVKQGRGILL